MDLQHIVETEVPIILCTEWILDFTVFKKFLKNNRKLPFHKWYTILKKKDWNFLRGFIFIQYRRHRQKLIIRTFFEN